MWTDPEQDWAELLERERLDPADVVAWGRDLEGQLVWLAKGNSVAGLVHILDRHQGHFATVGITAEELPNFLILALHQGEQVGVQGRDRAVYRVRYREQDWYVAISVGDNGFILGANPFGQRKVRQLLRRQNAADTPPSS